MEETSEIETRKTEINQLQSTVSNLESTVDDREADIDDLESELREIKNENSELQDELDAAQQTITGNIKDRILTLYESGIRYRDVALDEWNRASDNYGNRNNVTASRLWAYSYSHYDGAVEFFFLASTIASDNGHTSAADTATSANNYALETRDAANDFSLAAYYYSLDNFDQGDTYIERGNQHVDNADSYTVAPSSEIESELGI